MRHVFVLLGLMLSINLYPQDLKTNSIKWIDKYSNFNLSMKELIETAMEGAVQVVYSEGDGDKKSPYIIAIHKDVKITVLYDNKKVLTIMFEPVSTVGLERILIYLNHNTERITQNERSFYGKTYNGKYVLYEFKSFSLILLPNTLHDFLKEIDNNP